MKKYTHLLLVIPISLSTLFGNPPPEENPISQHEMSLDNRDQDQFVNTIFKENILLNLAYLRGAVNPKDINWDEVAKPFQYEFKLDPQKTFAFHSDIEDKYKESLTKTTNAHFNSQEGFKTDGYLFGDGVCQLASLLYWVAMDAGLWTEAPTSHDFRTIPDIPKEFGVSIFNNPYSLGSYTKQNLYITNNKGKPITFKFEYKDSKLSVSILE